MSGAIWIPAKSRPVDWRRIWPTWRKRKEPIHGNRGVPIAGRSLALVGCYERADQLDCAAGEFAAAAFGTADAIFVRACRRSRGRFWKKVMRWARPRSGDESQNGSHDDILLDSASAGALLASGGGFVIVRSASRFHHACEIIERTGGAIGCIASP